MKAISITASFSRNAGGPFYSISSLVKAQRQLGLEVKALGLKDEFFEQDKAQWNPVPVQAFDVIGPKSFGYAPGLYNAIVTNDPDVIHSHGIWMYTSIAAGKWGRKTGKPVVISPHGMLDPWALRNSRWKKTLASLFYESSNLKSSSCFRALCDSEANSIRSLNLNKPIAIVPNAVDLPSYLPETKTQNGPRTILYLGRIHEKKNIVPFLESWRAMPQALKSGWRVKIVGWGDKHHKNELFRYSDDKTSLEGPVYGKQKDDTLRDASAFILPSLSEGLPMAVLEAWSYGLPVLMSKECNLPEGFEAGAALETGTTERSITQALETFLRLSESQRREMGQKGRRLVEERFTWPMVATKMNSVYSWLLGQGPKPDCVIH